jgi:type II secretory ATPase GspE/PulE/Tfp pilus assembly ATPase PilB-like protein
MLPGRKFQKGFATATFGLLDGKTKGGRMASFSPHDADLVIDVAGIERTTVHVVFPAENVAYVGFHRDPGTPPARGDGSPELRIHVAGGRQFTVGVAAEAQRDPLGFYGVPVDFDSPYSEIFFYAHGVNAKERAEPLGEMLLSRGAVSAGNLSVGIDAQVANRSAPIGQILVEQRVVSNDSVEEAVHLQKRKKMRLGEVLVEAGLASPADIEAALAEQRKRGGKKLGEVLVELGVITEVDLALTLADKFDIPFANLDDYPIDPTAAAQVPRELIERYRILPLRGDARSFTIAIGDPLGTEVVDVLRFHLKRRIEEVLATPTQLRKFVDAYLLQADKPAEEFQKILVELSEDAQLSHVAVQAPQADPSAEASDSAVIRLVNQMIMDAYRRGASDIHVEPNGDERPTVVRFRIDGDCVLWQEVPSSVRSSLVARIKIMASLDIAERRKPQDGKIRFKFHDRVIELRVATIPTVNGNEDAVMRILAASKPLPVERLLLSERNLRETKRIAASPYGLILCVGPTGSGKTTTLHSILGSINTVDLKIWTAEDPVEITQPGLRQVQVQPRIGFTFAHAMRAFLRADPDVIMVGEMRDEETASTAVEASLTGHLVFSTLHTNSAPETVTRLIDMGVDRFTFADALLGVLAQRLVRALCTKCAVKQHGTREELDTVIAALGAEAVRARGLELGTSFGLHQPKGCDACGGSGYKGRLGLHELLIMNDELRRMVQQKASVHEIRRAATEGGMTTLLQDGVEKALAGRTELRQVLAVCSK